jgi:4-hydroxy-tetrahydrodipicolinate reductase
MSLRVAVCGAMGRMGAETVRAIVEAEDLELGALADLTNSDSAHGRVRGNLAEALADAPADVCVDFTRPDAAVANARIALEAGLAVVVGTSGMGEPELAEIRSASAASGRPVLVVPNFAIGAVLMMRFAAEAARWLPSSAVIEMHHPGKLDAPSGTAMHTAERIAAARPSDVASGTASPIVKADGAMGASVQGVPVHSVRLPGLIAHQMVLFGTRGETLTIRHDSMDRTSFMPGVLLAVREVGHLSGLHVGLESLMFPEGPKP